MLEQIYRNTSVYKQTEDTENKKNKGQFFTSLTTARFMGSWYVPVSRDIKILDPGAGNGSLGASVVEHLVENGLCDNISITYVENDPDVMSVLKASVNIIRTYCRNHNVTCHISIKDGNFILMDIKERYDIVICNPPYKKIRKESEEAVKMDRYVHGQPNIYALFMARGAELLKPGGAFVYITPRSWTSGAYFSLVRTALMDSLSFNKIHIFDDRDSSFSNEEVLQETMILFGIKGQQQDNITISVSRDDSFENTRTFQVRAAGIKNAGPNKYLLIPADQTEADLIDEINALPETFDSMGYIFKTGPVVEFRSEGSISSDKKPQFVPMFRSANIVGGEFIFPAETTKAQYVDGTVKKLLIKNSNTVLIRRLSAKEDRRRIQSCIYKKKGKNTYIGVENHVNYAARQDGKPLTLQEVEWIQEILSSDAYDVYFRLLNGSTQVNANELNLLPVRSRDHETQH